MDETKLKLYNSQREYVFRSIQILYDLSKQILHDKTKVSAFKSRFRKIEQIRDEYQDLTQKIHTLHLAAKPEYVIDQQSLSSIDDLYYAVISANDELQAQRGAGGSAPHGAAVLSAPGNDVIADRSHLNESFTYTRLPQLELPKFDSNIEHWQTFYETYVSIIHSKDYLPNIEKFHYLLSCLTGPALSIAKGVPVTADNYPIVFDALVKRYENKRVLAVACLEKILNYPPIKSGNLFELQSITSLLCESGKSLYNSIGEEKLGEFILFYLSARKLDESTRTSFEDKTNSDLPTFNDLLTFLQERVKNRESSQIKMSNPIRTFDGKPNTHPVGKKPNNSGGQKRSSYLSKSSAAAAVFNCVCCGGEHLIYRCPTFQALDSKSRLNLVKTKNLCQNCLRANHSVANCLSKLSCLNCGRRHHTLVHTQAQQVPPSPAQPLSSNITQASTSMHADNNRSLVLLGTIQLRLFNPSNGGQLLVRALIDSGAQDCFITTRCAKTLGLKIQCCNVSVAGLGQNTVCHVKGITRCDITPVHNNDPRFSIKPIVINNITGKMPATTIPIAVRDQCKHLVLADREFDTPAYIDLLIGAELFPAIYDGRRIPLGVGLPSALHSAFGWILTGVVETNNYSPPTAAASLLAATCTLDEQVKRFWEVEEIPHTPISVPEDLLCEQLYNKLTYREPSGRYVVPILIKNRELALGQSYTSAVSRLTNLEKKLARQPEVKVEYIHFMREYENLKHMYLTKPTSNTYLIPHHCVIRPEAVSTKLRVVFDASSRSSNGLSLNDIVYTGPKLQTDLVNIILKFRLHEVVFTCDISKMYRRLLIRPEDRHYQHIIWRESPSDPIQEYELATVTYGVRSSPYLAIRTLHRLVDDHGSQYPRASEAIRHETLMDDITTGAPSVSEAIELKNELINLLAHAKMELRKWSSNSKHFLDSVPEEHCQSPKIFCEDSDKRTLKILGVQFEPNLDNFTYSYLTIQNTEFTKRSILSYVARIFDPIGWLTPVILKAKLLLQELWRLSLSWDEPVPTDIAQNWQNFIIDLNNLNLIEIPRQVVPARATEFQLIGFCDGSSKAYGCCLYLRVVSDQQCQVHLLIAKSKVAPLKVITINRLELCAAVLLSKVVTHVHTLLSKKLNITNSVLFTDSSTVLSWLNTEPHRLKTFVAHRVVQINDATAQSVWRHVSTHDNPADLCSRGLSCAQLATCRDWWSGPQWLVNPIPDWPVSAVPVEPSSISELKQTKQSRSHVSTLESNLIDTILERSSNLISIQRILAWMCRFIQNSKLKLPERNRFNFLTSTELNNSLNLLIQHVQQTYFKDIVSNLISNKTLPKHILKLSPFVDSQRLLRVGGRLSQSRLSESTKHPYLLPKDSRLCILIIDFYHVTYLHCGPRQLQSLIQRRFWIIGIRNLIRSRLSKCVTCFKLKPIPIQPIMGNLPPSRLNSGQCFQTVGIDFGGPFLVKESRRRNAKTYKSYLCLFICHAVKAVHLELVTELTTEAFIAALDRFISRRGLCQAIVTDGGTNFIGAKRYLSEVTELLEQERDSVSKQLASRNVSWKINPPSGAHFGGIFESGIKSTKYHLKRVVGSQVLTFEELYTILTKIEAMLNSRPLVEISSDPNEVDALTAGHFLIGRPLVALPEPALGTISLRTRWQMVQRLSQSFWRVWQRDYLHTLQQKLKWSKDDGRKPKLGDIVTIVDTNLPANEWRLGRIIQIHPGADGIVRVVTLKTTRGQLIRPVVKICPLPISESH